MQRRSKSTILRAAVVLSFLTSAYTVVAEAVEPSIKTPTDYRFLPPTTGSMSGLDTTLGTVKLPPLSRNLRDKDKKLDKSNHLPLKPVKKPAVNSGSYSLTSMGDD